MQTITATALAHMQQQGVVNLIDVRTPAEFGATHAKGATNIPLDKLEPSSLAYCNGNTVYFICKSGIRAQKAMEKLAESGFSNMVQVEGGTDAWIDAKLPVLKGKKALGLEQQVRILIGSMALTGAGFVLAGETLGLALIGAVGVGMIYAGITNSCGVATLLAKAPWNQDSKACPAPAMSS